MTNIQITITKQILNTNIEILVSLKVIILKTGDRPTNTRWRNTVV